MLTRYENAQRNLESMDKPSRGFPTSGGRIFRSGNGFVVNSHMGGDVIKILPNDKFQILRVPRVDSTRSIPWWWEQLLLYHFPINPASISKIGDRTVYHCGEDEISYEIYEGLTVNVDGTPVDHKGWQATFDEQNRKSKAASKAANTCEKQVDDWELLRMARAVFARLFAESEQHFAQTDWDPDSEQFGFGDPYSISVPTSKGYLDIFRNRNLSSVEISGDSLSQDIQMNFWNGDLGDSEGMSLPSVRLNRYRLLQDIMEHNPERFEIERWAFRFSRPEEAAEAGEIPAPPPDRQVRAGGTVRSNAPHSIGFEYVLEDWNEPAVRFADGFEAYAIDGRFVPPEFVTAPNSIDADQLMSCPNSEVRRIGIDIYGDRLLEDVGATIVDNDPEHGKLYHIYPNTDEEDSSNTGRGTFPRPIRPMPDIAILEVICPTSGRVFHHPVNERCTSAHEARASMWGLRPNEFDPVVET